MLKQRARAAGRFNLIACRSKGPAKFRANQIDLSGRWPDADGKAKIADHDFHYPATPCVTEMFKSKPFVQAFLRHQVVQLYLRGTQAQGLRPWVEASCSGASHNTD